MSFFAFNLSKHSQCSTGEIIEFAALAPDNATAGTPIPGKIPSPHKISLLKGVFPRTARTWFLFDTASTVL